MRRNRVVVFFYAFLCLLLSLLTGCDGINEYSFAKIKSPQVKEIAIQGTWKVTNIKKVDENIDASLKIDDHLYFTNQMVIIKDQKYNNVNYKYKDVNVYQYMLYNYKVNSDFINLKTNSNGILSLSTDDRLLYEFITIDNKNILMYGNNTLYYLKKDDGFDIKNIKIQENGVQKKNDMDKTSKGSSGILLGIRSGDSSYRTIWISYKNDAIADSIECKNLLVPRNKGFWVVGLKEVGNKRNIFASRIESYKNNNIEYNSINTNITNDIISYVANDYIFLEYTNGVRVLPIDSLTTKKGLKISDILGQSGKENMETSYNAMVSNNSQLKSDTKPNEEDFVLVRKNGHWIMQGRVYDKSRDNFWSYDMNLIPPANMVRYDELSISWNKVLERVPDAIDIFTSPNNQLAIIVNQSEIEVFKIVNGGLDSNPLSQINLKNDEHIIMAEWALDEYVDSWQHMLSSINDVPNK